MPKIDPYVHLEGTVRPATLLRLADRHGVTLPAENEASLARWLRYRSYTQFLEVVMTVRSCIRRASDLEEVTRDFLTAAWEDGVVYSEAVIAPKALGSSGDQEFHARVDAINHARSWAARELGVGMSIVVDLPRTARIDDAVHATRRAAERRGEGVVAVGVNGPDEGKPIGEFAPVFAAAAEGGLRTVVHVGDTGGSEAIWNALEVGPPSRIVHGLTAAGDDRLVAELAANGPMLAMCPSGHVLTQLVGSHSEHPLPRLVQAGVPVGLCTDWQWVFGTNLSAEYLAVFRACGQAHGWDRRNLEQLVLQGVEQTFLSDHDRSELRRRFHAKFRELSGRRRPIEPRPRLERGRMSPRRS
jgi:adenosine deaminase